MIAIKKCTPDDLKTLQEISCRTYYDTFAHVNTDANMRSYLEKSFNHDKLHNEIRNINSSFYFLYLDDSLAGYIKLNTYQAQTDIYDPQSIEIERIYVSSDFQGKGLGRTLMNKAIEFAEQQGKTYIWLGVWEKNDKAIQFYQHEGFYTIGQHLFLMGEERQTDYIMRKDLMKNGKIR